MNLLSKKKVTPVDPIENLQVQSEAAISVFSETLNRLSDANSSVEVEEERELEARAKIDQRLEKLASIKTKNQNFITKINQLFE